jgi:starch-binding outer membrane protein, SusD/RagB family
MKSRTIIYRLMTILISLSFLYNLNSCDDYFEVVPVSEFSTENVFINTDYARQAVLGIYQLMTRDEGYTKRLNMYYTVDTDIAMCSGQLDNGRRGIARYAANSGNTEIQRPWENLYAGIERANVCIRYIPESPVFSGGTEAQAREMRRLHGEALTLRALFYYELVRNWGDVPFKTKNAEAGDDFYLPKTDRDIILEQIIEDLELAEELVPWRSEVPSDERITKGAVKGLMARVALARAGYSLRREGGMLRGSDHLTYYKIARDKTLEIMESGQHTLNPSFENVFRTHCRRQLDTQYGESMWEVGMGQYTSGEVGYYIGNKTHDLSRYGRADGGIRAIPTYYYSFHPHDTRRDITISLYRIDENNLQVLEDPRNIYIAKWRREWIEPVFPGTDKFNGINWVLLRYSDVLLMFAEAENELNNGPTAAAIEAFRKVRERAFAGNVGQMPEIPATYQEFFEEIVQERAWELGGEGIRKFDLIRWNRLNSNLAGMKAELNKLTLNVSPYESVPSRMVWRNNGELLEFLNYNTPLDSATIADRDTIMWPFVTNWTAAVNEEYIQSIAEFFEPDRKELLPIHQVTIDNNPNLKNDFGY